MKVVFVGAGPGDPDLLTQKAARLIATARICVYAGSLVSPAIIALLPQDARLHDSAAMTLDEIVAVFSDAQAANSDVIRLHTGEPSLYGAIAEQMVALDRLGIDYEVVPGISAFQAAAAALRVELTLPEISQPVILTRAAGRTPVPEKQNLAHLAATRSTLCLYLSAGQVAEVCAACEPFYGPGCPVALVYHASWPDQQIIRSTLAGLPALAVPAAIKRTALILIGYALGPLAANSRLYDPLFSHGYRSAKTP